VTKIKSMRETTTQRAGREDYSAPTLQEFGSVGTLTQAGTTSTVNEGMDMVAGMMGPRP